MNQQGKRRSKSSLNPLFASAPRYPFQIRQKLRAAGHQNVRFVLLDVTKADQIQAAKGRIEKEEGKLDTLVNNAAISKMDAEQSPVAINISVIRETMETNLYGVIQTTLTFLPLLRKSTNPIILNVSTGLGSNSWMATSRPAATPYHFIAYNTSKAAMNSYTISLAQELKKEGNKVNAATPGFVSSNLNNWMKGGRTLEEGALSLLPHALLDADGPTGKFFGSDGQEFPW